MAVSQTIAFMKRTRAGMQGWPLYTAAVRPSSALAHLHMVTTFTTYGSSLITWGPLLHMVTASAPSGALALAAHA